MYEVRFCCLIPRHQKLKLSKLTDNPDGASCALCCCYALEGYFGSDSVHSSGVNMRSHFLRKLLEGYQLLAIQQKIASHDINGMHLASYDYSDDESDAAAGAGIVARTLSSDIINWCNAALADTLLPDEKRKTRLIQMILQCGIDRLHLSKMNTGTASSSALDQPGSPSTILALVRQIEDTSGMWLEKLRSRFLLIKLHLNFEHQVSNLVKQRSDNRILRRRAASAGECLNPLPPGNRKKSRNAVMDQVISIIPLAESGSRRLWREKLKQNLFIGAQYYLLASSLGFGLLAALPYEEVAACDYVPSIPGISRRSESISPTEYVF